jgi:hypothetical protein
MSSKTHYEFKPLNVGRWVIWGVFSLLMMVAPLLFTSSLSHTMLSQMGHRHHRLPELQTCCWGRGAC